MEQRQETVHVKIIFYGFERNLVRGIRLVCCSFFNGLIRFTRRIYSRVSNTRGGRNKRGEGGGGGGGGGGGKNTAIRNFIEMKSSNDLVKISTKRA